MREQLPQRASILYIEDNSSNLKLIERLLARQRPTIKLFTASHGASGIKLTLEEQPDLILLDLHLPDFDGDKVIERLRTDPRTDAIPIVMISADATSTQVDRLMAAGAQDYLTKPLDIRQFLSVVDEVLASTVESEKPTPLLA